MTDLTEVELVYCGHMALRAAGKVGEIWATVEAVERWIATKGEGVMLGRIDNLKCGLFAAKRTEPIIGGVYKVKAVVEGGKPIQLGATKSFCRRIEEGMADLYAASRAVDARIAAERKAAKLKTENPIAEELRGLRELYRTASPENRIALEVIVLKALRSGF